MSVIKINFEIKQFVQLFKTLKGVNDVHTQLEILRKLTVNFTVNKR